MQSVLGARVGPRKGSPGLSGRTGDDCDGALAAPEEVGKDETGQVDYGEDVEFEYVSVYLNVGVLPSRSLTLASVVDHDVQLRKCANSR